LPPTDCRTSLRPWARTIQSRTGHRGAYKSLNLQSFVARGPVISLAALGRDARLGGDASAEPSRARLSVAGAGGVQ
jgi:hypothetical protein